PELRFAGLGCFYGFLGPNGAGKSTTIKTFIVIAASSEVIWFGVPGLLLDPQAHFVADCFYFGGVHGETLGGKSVETAGGFSTELVAEDVLALLKQPDEENHLFVAQFEVGTEAAGPASAAPQFHRLAAGGLHVFERDIIVRVLRRKLE